MSGTKYGSLLAFVAAAVATILIIAAEQWPLSDATRDRPVPPLQMAPPPAGLGAPTALNRLRTAPIVDDDTYRRDAFGSDWLDLNRDGCNTREETLARDLRDVRLADDDCNVEAGTLRDPYTGRTVTFVEDDDPSSVQVDHVYALSRAWDAGAKRWTSERRRAFANDPLNLLAVDGPTNASKGDQGPETWMPLNRGFVCAYARRYTQVAYRYRLPITADDRESLRLALGTC